MFKYPNSNFGPKIVYNDLNHIRRRESRKKYYSKNHAKVIECNRKWREKNREKYREYQKNRMRKWRKANPELARQQKKRDYYKDVEKSRRYSKNYMKKWGKEHPDRIKQINKNNHLKHREKHLELMNKRRLRVRLKALEIVGKGRIECSNCGQKDIRILQINHINGGGRIDTRKFNGNGSFYYAIINGKRKTNDLNILCAVCNQAHFIEHKYGVKYDVKPI